MSVYLANTIWAPLVILWYGFPLVWLFMAAGLGVEYLTIRRYVRAQATARSVWRSVLLANLVSYLLGNVILAVTPVLIPKHSLSALVTVFGISYAVSVLVETPFLVGRIPAPRPRVIEAALLGNFYSYAVLFAGFVLWFHPRGVVRVFYPEF